MALQWGVVNYVVEPEKLAEAALEYCTKITTRSRAGIATMKRLAREGLEGSLADGLKLEQDIVTGALLSDDVSEGLAAFEGRRAPVSSPDQDAPSSAHGVPGLRRVPCAL